MMPEASLIQQLRTIVGRRHVLTTQRQTASFRMGFRTGSGEALAVARPRTLVEQWRVVQACVKADVSVILQASNTGLTGGSTPDGADYPGGVVIVSTTRIKGLHLIRDNRQVICLPGTTLYELECALRPLGREPHSVIGSSCIGASVIGGICNNSGGSLIQRGPAFTQLALYGTVTDNGELRLVNHLGVELGDDPEEVLHRVESGAFDENDVLPSEDRWAHDRSYVSHIRDIDSPIPARFNADPRCLFETSGSAGKLVLFAVRLDTFPSQTRTATFYVGTNDPDRLTEIRRTILGSFDCLPIAGEYMHRAAFDIADRYGKDMFKAIELLGTDRLPLLFAAKARFDSFMARLLLAGANLSDRIMQQVGRLLPDHLPSRLRNFRDLYEHHLILKMPENGIAPARDLLQGLAADGSTGFFECTREEGAKAFLHRFVAAGSAVRYRAIHSDAVEDIVPLDVALPRNLRAWDRQLPAELKADVIHALFYGHFFCHVFHEDYIVRKGANPTLFEQRLWALLDEQKAEYPAEHNVGHIYRAKPELERFYRQIDPRNQLNPGIGQTSRQRSWANAEPAPLAGVRGEPVSQSGTDNGGSEQ